jgi:hypothetical protein
MIRIIQAIFLISILCFISTDSVANDDSNQPVSVYPRICKEGLYSQPKGSFKLAVFCDDAIGTNIGVIYHDPENDSYWQDPKWSKDVTSFWWGLKGDLLYISTSGIYGSGGVYELDLMNRKSIFILPDGYPPTAGTYSSEIMKYNAESNSLECKIEYFHREKKKPISETIEIQLKNIR